MNIKPFNFKLLYRRTALIIYDIISVIAASYLSLLVRYEFRMDQIPRYFLEPVTKALPFAIILTLMLFYLFRLYSSLWAFAGESELTAW